MLYWKKINGKNKSGAVELRQQKTTGQPEKRVARSLCLLYN